AGPAPPKAGSGVHTWSAADPLPRTDVRRGDGTHLAALPLGAPAFDPAALPRWEFVTIDGPDGVKLPARLLKPAGLDPGRRYPAIVYHYAEPAPPTPGGPQRPR